MRDIILIPGTDNPDTIQENPVEVESLAKKLEGMATNSNLLPFGYGGEYFGWYNYCYLISCSVVLTNYGTQKNA